MENKESNPRTYLANRKRLRKTCEVFLNLLELNSKSIYSYVNSRLLNDSNSLTNRYIEYPKNILAEFKSLYSKNMPQVNIGESENYKVQFQGIIDMALIALISNRAKNFYNKSLTEKNMSEDVKKKMTSEKAVALKHKDDALSDLLSCIFVLENTCSFFKNYFSYGEIIDEEGNKAFTMDIPYIGQISLHYGNNSNREKIIEFAREQAISILKQNKNLGLINEEQLSELIKKVNSNEFLPSYGCQLYETDSSIPLKYSGEKISKLRKKLNIDKTFKNITEQDLIKLFNAKLNARERHYVGVKMGLSKEQLIFLDRERSFIDSLRDKYTNDCNLDDISKIGDYLTKDEKSFTPDKN